MTTLYSAAATREYEQLFDQQNKSKIGLNEITKLIRNIVATFDQQTVENMLCLFNPQFQGSFDKKGFVRFSYMCKATTQASRDLPDLIFYATDEDMDEKISMDELNHIYQLLGLTFDQQLRQKLCSDSEITYERYKKIIELIQRAFNE